MSFSCKWSCYDKFNLSFSSIRLVKIVSECGSSNFAGTPNGSACSVARSCSFTLLANYYARHCSYLLNALIAFSLYLPFYSCKAIRLIYLSWKTASSLSRKRLTGILLTHEKDDEGNIVARAFSITWSASSLARAFNALIILAMFDFASLSFLFAFAARLLYRSLSTRDAKVGSLCGQSSFIGMSRGNGLSSRRSYSFCANANYVARALSANS